MPSPVAHAVGGVAAAMLVDSLACRPRLTIPLAAAAAVLAMAPDLDLLVGSHRTYTHSIGGVAAVGLAICLVLALRVARWPRAAAALTVAYGSHLLLDWLARDYSEPAGLTALWPFSSEYKISGLNLFLAVSRRHWVPEEFILGNMIAFAWEMAVLLPLLVLIWARWSRQTLAE